MEINKGRTKKDSNLRSNGENNVGKIDPTYGMRIKLMKEEKIK